jgi:hypothetical protein
MKILHEQALELLAAAGCKVENDHIVKISSDLVLQAIDSTPKNIAVYDREANHCMDVGGRRAYFGTGSDLILSKTSGTRVSSRTFAVRPGWPMPCPISILSCRLHTHLTVRRNGHSWPAFKP